MFTFQKPYSYLLLKYRSCPTSNCNVKHGIFFKFSPFLILRCRQTFGKETHLTHNSELRKLYLCSSEQNCSIFKTPLLESPSTWGQPSPENILPQ